MKERTQYTIQITLRLQCIKDCMKLNTTHHNVHMYKFVQIVGQTPHTSTLCTLLLGDFCPPNPVHLAAQPVSFTMETPMDRDVYRPLVYVTQRNAVIQLTTLHRHVGA